VFPERICLRACALALLFGSLFFSLRAGAAASPVSILAPSQSAELEAAADFIGDWEYRWGDSPGEESANAALKWQPLGRKAIPNPPGRQGRRFLWLRTRLSGPDVDDATLYLGIVNQLFEAFIDGELVYRFGQLDGDGPDARRFLGYPMHFIPLGRGYAGRVLTLRIYSEHIAIGIGSPLRIGSKVFIIRDTLRKDAGKVFVGIVLGAIGLFVLGLYLTERHERAYLYYAGFAFTMGVWMLCQMRGRNFLFDMPLLWTHVEYFSIEAAIALLSLFLLQVLGRGPLGLMPVVAAALVSYTAGAALLVATGVVGVMRTLVVFEVTLLFVIAYFVLSIGALLRKGDSDARLFAMGFAASVLFGAYDVLSAISILPRNSTALTPFGQGLFVVSLGAILVRRFRKVHSDLLVTKKELSEKVHALQVRNAEIENLNEELRHQIEARSSQLLHTLIGASSSGQEILPIFSDGDIISDRYRVVRMIGQGAMGVVYEVERLHDGRRFAAKVLSGRAHRRDLARFAREGQLLARLKHENLVSIADIDVTTSRLAYIVMELVDGKTLAEENARFGDLRFVLPILRQLSGALAAVHAQGVVHRDLKPANILIGKAASDAAPLIKVVDFGVSALLAGENSESGEPAQAAPSPKERTPEVDLMALERTDPAAGRKSTQKKPADAARKSDVLTQTGVIMGTPLYMAPELIRGARLARPASDMFSFGIVAYELVSGRLPSDSPPMLLGLKPFLRWYTPLAVLCPDLPADIGGLIERCLDAAPENRPTAAELHAALKRL
jgi:hypothetical protein